MAPRSFTAVMDRNNLNIFKGRQGGTLFGRYGAAPLITTLVAASGQLEVPEDYLPAGWFSEDGITFSQSTETSEIPGWGSSVALRTDITSEERTFAFTALETNAVTLELKSGLAPADVSTAGEWKQDILSTPDTVYWRALNLAKDGAGSDVVYFAKVFHRCMPSEKGDEVWSDADQAMQYEMTFKCEPDPVTGTIGTEFIFGPGLLTRAAAMGLTVATP